MEAERNCWVQDGKDISKLSCALVKNEVFTLSEETSEVEYGQGLVHTVEIYQLVACHETEMMFLTFPANS